jgi:hypothetical protein
MATKIRSTTSFREEVKLLVPCCKFHGMLQNVTGMKGDNSQAKFAAISSKVSPAPLPDVSIGYFQTALVDETGMIRKGPSAWDTLCDTTP